MKIYHCDVCGHQIYFENSLCLSCNSQLGYLPVLDRMISLNSVDGQYKPCQNYHQENICNWMTLKDDPEDFCLSCRLNEMIPDLSIPENRGYWYRLELAKRRLVYSLLQLGLPLKNKKENPGHGLAFVFLADEDMPAMEETKKVMMGHSQGTITMNIAEANDAFREKIRLEMNEEYRTLLGHFRHEIGHYYWFLLIADNQDLLSEFRQIFGDETKDYTEALKRYYEEGPLLDWSKQYLCAYASAHPWEDWAETWGYYFYMLDTLETAQALGLTARFTQDEMIHWEDHGQVFETMIGQWGYLCATLNCLNRSMGTKDVNPLVWTDTGIEKLKFIHKVILQFNERVKR